MDESEYCTNGSSYFCLKLFVIAACRPFKKQRVMPEAAAPSTAARQPDTKASLGAEEADATLAPSSSAAGLLDAEKDKPEGLNPPSGQNVGVGVADASARDSELAGSAEQQPAEQQGVQGSGAFSISPRETPQPSPVTSSIGTPRADSGESSSFQTSVPQPFDMFAMQAVRHPPCSFTTCPCSAFHLDRIHFQQLVTGYT